MKERQVARSTPQRRVYKAPELKKQQNLKEITLFTNLQPPD
jgi:hypothetical protein